MKIFLAIGLIFLLMTPVIQAELTQADLREIEAIVQKNHVQLREYIDSKFAAHEVRITALETKITILGAKMEARFETMDERFKGMDRQFDEVDKRLQMLMAFVTALVALITVAVGVPQIIIAFRGRREADWQKEIERLSAEIETLKQSRIIQP